MCFIRGHERPEILAWSLPTTYHPVIPSSAAHHRITPMFLVPVCISNSYSSSLWPISSPVTSKSSFFSAQVSVSLHTWISSHFLHSSPSRFCFSVFSKPASPPEELWCLRDIHRKDKIPLKLSDNFFLVLRVLSWSLVISLTSLCPMLVRGMNSCAGWGSDVWLRQHQELQQIQECTF